MSVVYAGPLVILMMFQVVSIFFSFCHIAVEMKFMVVEQSIDGTDCPNFLHAG